MNEKEIEIQNKINFSKKHLLIKRIDIIFIIISIFLVVLRYNGIIRFSPTWIIVSIFFVYWLFSFAYLVETTKIKKKERIINTYDEEKDNECIEFDREYSTFVTIKKSQSTSNKILIDRFVLIFIFIIFVMPIIMTDRNFTIKEFLYNAKETIAKVTNIDYNISEKKVYDENSDYTLKYVKEFIYELSYNINNQNYKYYYSSKREYSSIKVAQEAQPVYFLDDEINIYYQIDNPNIIKINVSMFPDSIISILFLIPLSTQVIWLHFIKTIYENENKNLFLNV